MSTPIETEAPLVHTLAEISEILRVSKGSVNELIQTGELESFKVGHRRLIARTALLDFINSAYKKAS